MELVKKDLYLDKIAPFFDIINSINDYINKIKENYEELNMYYKNSFPFRCCNIWISSFRSLFITYTFI